MYRIRINEFERNDPIKWTKPMNEMCKDHYHLKGKQLMEYSFDLPISLCLSLIFRANSNYCYPDCQIVNNKDVLKAHRVWIYTGLRTSNYKENIAFSSDTLMITVGIVKYQTFQTRVADFVRRVFNYYQEPLRTFHDKNCTSVSREVFDYKTNKIQDITKSLKVDSITLKPSVRWLHPRLFTNVNKPEYLIMLENLTNNQWMCFNEK